MLGRQEIKELERRVDLVEMNLAKLSSLENVVGKLDSILSKTAESVNHLNTYMERQEERNDVKDRWSKIIIGTIAMAIPVFASVAGYFINNLEVKISRLEENTMRQSMILAELSTKIKLFANKP